MLQVPQKYRLDVAAPTPITSQRQHEEYLSVLEKLTQKAKPTSQEERYAELLITLIEAYEEEHHPVPEASPAGVEGTDGWQWFAAERFGAAVWFGEHRVGSA